MAELVGSQLGSCHILRRIDGGGMGDIYLAEQAVLGRQVVVKVLRGAQYSSGNDATRKEITQQLEQEARAIAALDHPHILPLYEYGEQQGVHYLVMPYVPDGSLSDLYSPGPLHRFDLPLAPALAADLIHQTAEALQYAHDHGLIHRDIKPGNILIRTLPGTMEQPGATEATSPTQYFVLLADFGLARFATDLVGQTANTGTPLFSAPEQYRGKPGAATDQYALACVAYLLFSGQPVFDGNLAELHHQHLNVQPTPITRINPKLPSALDAMLLRALSKEPAQRFSRVLDFAQALSNVIQPSLSTNLQAAPSSFANLPFPPIAAGSMPLPHADEANIFTIPADGHASTPTTVSAAWSAANATTDPASGSLSRTPRTTQSSPTSSALPMTAPSLDRYKSVLVPAPTDGSGISGNSSDAPATALPTHYRVQRRWVRIPRPRRIVVIGVAVMLLVIVLGGLGVQAYQRLTAPSPAALHTLSLTNGGSVTIKQLPPLQQGQQPTAQSQRPTLLLATNGQGAGQADTQRGLPTLTPQASLPASDATGGNTNAFAGLQQTQPSLNQADIGVAEPVDVSIASSDQYLIEVVDSVIQITDLTDASANVQIAAASLFSVVLHAGYELGQGRTYLDAGSGRWLIIMNETGGAGAAVTQGYFDIAISQGAAANGQWNVYQFATTLAGVPGFGGCTWADYPQVGSDATTFYFTGNSFQCGANGAFTGAMLWEVGKQAATSGAAKSVYRFWGFKNSKNQPAMTLTPATEAANDTTEWLLSNDAGYVDNGQQSNRVMVWGITHSGAPSANDAIVSTTITLPAAYADPPAAVQRGSGTRLNSGDARITSAYLANGHLYAAFTTAVNWSGDTNTRSGIYWLDIMPQVVQGSPALSATLAESGVFGFTGAYLTYPSLVATSAGDVALTAQMSSSLLYPDLIYTGRLHTDTPGTMGQQSGSTLLLTQDELAAATTSDGRWVDYSNACLSLSSSGGAPASLWVTSIYADQFQSGQWSTALGQLNAIGS